MMVIFSRISLRTFFLSMSVSWSQIAEKFRSIAAGFECLAWILIETVEAGEALVYSLAPILKIPLLKIVDEPGFGDRRYRMHGLVLRCIRREARVNVEDKQTFAWMGRYRGVLFDRRGWKLLCGCYWWVHGPFWPMASRG